MIYMVEMALIDTARRAEWDAWYLSHMKKAALDPWHSGDTALRVPYAACIAVCGFAPGGRT